MAKKLTSHVHVHDPERGTRVFGPDDEVPAWAEKLITNPSAWEGSDDVAGEAEPPRSGRGSTKEAWAAYADSLGVAVPDDASKDDIAALVDSYKGTAPAV